MITFHHSKFLFREMVHGWHHGSLFVLCVILSLSTMIGLNSFKGGVNRSLFRDARQLHGADIIIHSHYPLSLGLLQEVKRLEGEGKVSSTMVYEFYSVIRSADEGENLFAAIKLVDGNFPLYGKVELLSGLELSIQLKRGSCIVAEDVLKRMGLAIGDYLRVGSGRLQIVDVVTYESDSPVNILSFGPRVFISEDDLETIDLVKKGSRIAYEKLLKVAKDDEIETAVQRLRKIAVPEQERVNSYLEESSGVKRFFDNLLFFLSLISIFTLLLAGLGMQSCLTALLYQKKKTMAISRTFGATNRFIVLHYLNHVVLLGLVGTVLGISSGWILGKYFPYLFEGLLPIQGDTSMSLMDAGEGVFLGLAVVLLFTILPLNRFKDVKPIEMLRNDPGSGNTSSFFFMVLAGGAVFITVLIIRHLEDKMIGLLFMAGVLALILATSFLAAAAVRAVKSLPAAFLSLRQAITSMTRKGNSTQSVLVTLSSALALLFSIFLVEQNLHNSYIESYPEDAPDVFCIDIQPDQRDGFLSFFTNPPDIFPIIRARLVAINDNPINREEELRKKSDNFAREFNLTYRDKLLADERLVAGKALFPEKKNGKPILQVSILDDVADMGDLELGDRLRFNIQGVELEATITSIRTRTQSMLFPFFYFVFPPEYLKEAPQTLFSAVTTEKEDLPLLQKKIVKRFPNISFINVAETAREIESLMLKLTSIINFFSLFSILAGCLIVVSSILATRIERTREAVYYKILGSSKAFVYRVFLFENGIIGLLSGMIALLIAHVGSWFVCHYVFEIDYSANGIASLTLLTATVILVIAVGFVSSLTIIRQKPARFLRQYGNG